MKERENFSQLDCQCSPVATVDVPFIHQGPYMRFVQFPLTEEIVEHTVQLSDDSDSKTERRLGRKNVKRTRDWRISRGIWALEESLEVKQEKSVLDVSSSSSSSSLSSYRGISTTGLGIDNKDAGQRRSTLHFALDDQGTSTAETGGLRPPVRLPRCTRSLETEEEVSGRQR